MEINYTIPEGIKNVRIDVGMSSTGPHTCYWLRKYNNLAVIGFEPNPDNFISLHDGNMFVQNAYQLVDNEKIITKNGEVICNYSEKNNVFIGFDFAIDDVEQPTQKTFYCTSILNTGCSSLYKPIEGKLNGVTLEKEVTVTAVPLKMILEKFPFDRIPYIDYLKVDTQANDINVIKSCGEYLKKACFVSCEYYTNGEYENEKGQSESFTQLNEIMKEGGFRCYSRSGVDAFFVNENLMEYVFENGILNDLADMENGLNYII